MVISDAKMREVVISDAKMGGVVHPLTVNGAVGAGLLSLLLGHG
jgi:hypothetical protein